MSRVFLLVLGISLPLASQSCYEENGGPGFGDNVSMGGPNLLLAIKVTIPTNLTVSRIEVFTGEGTGLNTIAIWDHVASGNQPGVSLGMGSWSMVTANGWQGADLQSPISLISGLTYWVVWAPQNGSQASVEVPNPANILQQYRGSFTGGASWTGPFMGASNAWKFRFFCGVTPMTFQVNQQDCTMVVGGILSNGQGPAITNVGVGVNTTASFSGVAGAPWDIAVSQNVPLVPLGLVTPQGQILNIDLLNLMWLGGATFNNAFAPFSTSVSLPTSGASLSGQMVIVTPSHPEGFCLSQACQVQT